MKEEALTVKVHTGTLVFSVVSSSSKLHFSSHWNVQTLGFSIMGDFSHELPSQPAIDAAKQANFQTR